MTEATSFIRLKADWLVGLQPEVTISPMQMLKAKKPRQRARRSKKVAQLSP